MALWCWPLMEFSPAKLNVPSPLTPFLSLWFLPSFLPSLWNLGQEKKTRLQMLPNLLCLTPEPLAFENSSKDFGTFVLWLYSDNFPQSHGWLMSSILAGGWWEGGSQVKVVMHRRVKCTAECPNTLCCHDHFILAIDGLKIHDNLVIEAPLLFFWTRSLFLNKTVSEEQTNKQTNREDKEFSGLFICVKGSHL